MVNETIKPGERTHIRGNSETNTKVSETSTKVSTQDKTVKRWRQCQNMYEEGNQLQQTSQEKERGRH